MKINQTLAAVLCLLLGTASSWAQVGTAFTYQGRLTDGAGLANGPYDFEFQLFDAATLGVGSSVQTLGDVTVVNGLFTVKLDFGTAFTGSPKWLEIRVRPGASVGAYTALTPRQELTPSPNAVFSATTGDPNVQRRTVAPSCPAGQYVQALAADGTPTCVADASGTVTAVTATGPITSSGGATPNLSLTGGVDGQILAAPGGIPGWTGSPSVSGSITLVNPSTASAGNIMKGGNPFIHNFGTRNTFIGEGAGNFTMTGNSNTATGFSALSGNTVGISNTASGKGALQSNTTGSNNTAAGALALLNNTAASKNTAIGVGALEAQSFSSSGPWDSHNTAVGYQALAFNQPTAVDNGADNTATGSVALQHNTTGYDNTASGAFTLTANTSGFSNVASGAATLFSNTTGSANIAAGAYALGSNTTGSNNIAVGANAGSALTIEDNNIDIGHAGVAGEASTIRIGTPGTHAAAFISGVTGVTPGSAALPVVIDSSGQLGTTTSLTASSFSGSLAGEVTGSQGATVVSNAVSTNAAGAIVRRDGLGDFSARTTTLSGSLYLPDTGQFPLGGGSYQYVGYLGLGGLPFLHGLNGNTFVGGGAGTQNGSFGMTGSNNTGIGRQALEFSTFGSANTAMGDSALVFNFGGNDNTANGAFALMLSVGANENTAIGKAALRSTRTASRNTAVGSGALELQETTSLSASAWNTDNTAVGYFALHNNNSSSTSNGIQNTAIGVQALSSNTTGLQNTAIGAAALSGNQSGLYNVAVGGSALGTNVVGVFNTAVGNNALVSSTGDRNVGLGMSAGSSLTNGSDNIDIGNVGVAGDSHTIRIGNAAHTSTFIAGNTVIAGTLEWSGTATGAGTIGIPNGGTGAGTAIAARANLGAAASGVNNDITSLGSLSNVFASSSVSGSSGVVISATASQTSGGWDGIDGLTYSPGGIGVYGANGAGTAGVGVEGLSVGNGSSGVMGIGVGYGVWGQTLSPVGYGLYTPDRAYVGGNLGLGGSLDLLASTSGAGNITKAGTIFINNVGVDNTFIGVSSGNPAGLTGTGDTGAGVLSLASNTLGNYNTAVGGAALRFNTTASQNTAMGISALQQQSYNPGLAWSSDNTAVGFHALLSNQPTSIANGYENTALGSSTLTLNTTGSFNTATGFSALSASVTGDYNTADGMNALVHNTGGSQNVAVGVSALNANVGGIGNTAVGNDSLFANTSGSNNTAVGYLADVTSGGLTNATAIGYQAVVNASNKIRLGSSAVTVIEGQVAYTFPSDRTKKENFRNVDAQEVLEKLRAMSVTSWNYIGHDPKTFRHYGPMAQDFFAAFGRDEVGAIGTETTINSGDITAILMIGLKGLDGQVQKDQSTIQAQAEEIQRQALDLKQQTRRLTELEENRKALAAEVASLKTQVGRITELEAQAARVADLLQSLAPKQAAAATSQGTSTEKHR